MFSTCAFSVTDSGIANVEAKKWVEVPSSSKLYELLLSHIAKHAQNAQSFSAEVTGSSKKSCCKSKTSSGCCDDGRVSLDIGIGTFRFSDFEGNKYFAIHQTVGEPVGTQCGASQLKNIIVLTEGCENKLKDFFSKLVELSEATTKGVTTIFNFQARHCYWRRSGSVKSRPLESVILPKSVKDAFIADIANFLSEDMQSFYETHGIPYRRSFLFYGVPGAGKTSFVQAIAGHFERSISYLQMDPQLTDASLRSAMETLPSDTIVVIEDIDALFGKDRESMNKKSALTFSGLLNALDGVGSSSGQASLYAQFSVGFDWWGLLVGGFESNFAIPLANFATSNQSLNLWAVPQIYILTTNLRDQLDPALIRKGRVDVQVPFTHACDEQLEQMWRSFYPAAASRAGDFVAGMRRALEGKEVTTADLQHFFVMQMRSSPEQALEAAGSLAEDLREREKEAADAASKEAAAKEEKKVDKDGDKACEGQAAADQTNGAAEAAAPASAAQVQHVHLHVHGEKGVVVTMEGKAKPAAVKGVAAAAVSDSEEEE